MDIPEKYLEIIKKVRVKYHELGGKYQEITGTVLEEYREITGKVLGKYL